MQLLTRREPSLAVASGRAEARGSRYRMGTCLQAERPRWTPPSTLRTIETASRKKFCSAAEAFAERTRVLSIAHHKPVALLRILQQRSKLPFAAEAFGIIIAEQVWSCDRAWSCYRALFLGESFGGA